MVDNIDKNRKPAPGVGSYLWMYASSAIVLVSGLAVYHFAGKMLGTDGFAEFSLSRRAINLFTPVLVLGLGVALPRRMAGVESTFENDRSLTSFWVASGCVLAANLAFSVAANLYSEQVAFLLFGTTRLQILIMPVTVFLAGVSLHSVLWAFFRGRFQFRESSILEICNIAIIPLLAFAGGVIDTRTVLLRAGVGMSLVCLALLLRMAWTSRLRLVESWSVARDLLSYGIPRVPGDLALGALMALPSIIVAHVYGVERGGYVAFGGTLLALAGAVVAPIGTALLPRAANLIQNRDLTQLRKEVVQLGVLSVAIAVTGVGVAQLTLNWLIPVYLGEEFVSSVPIIRLLALSAIPYIMFSALRSVVDAAFRKAINARNICLSVIFFGAATALFHYSGLGVDGVLWANLAGHVLLAALTIVEVVRIFRVDEPGDDGNWTLGR